MTRAEALDAALAALDADPEQARELIRRARDLPDPCAACGGAADPAVDALLKEASPSGLPLRAVLRDRARGRDLHGLATLARLREAGLLDADHRITAAGRAALARADR